MSLHVDSSDSSDSADASGVSTYFFWLDSHGVRSSVGERFAGLVQRDVIAETIVVAVQRVYLSPETDPETGVLRLGELRAALRHA